MKSYLEYINFFNKIDSVSMMSDKAYVMYHKILKKFNALHWSYEWVGIGNCELMSFVRAKKEADAIRYRRELIKLGLIDYKRGKRGEICEYKLMYENEQYSSKTGSDFGSEKTSVPKHNSVSGFGSTYKDKDLEKRLKKNKDNKKVRKTAFCNFEQRDTTYADLDEAYFEELRKATE